MRNKFFAIFLLFIAFSFSSAITPKGPGDNADDFTLKGVDGKEYNLSTALNSSNYVLVVFLSTECPFVQPYTDRLNSISNEYGSKGITMWGINANNTESIETVKSHAEQKGYPFPVLKDFKNVVADMLEATRTPEVFLIGKDKTILYHGRIDDNRDAEKVTTNDLRNALDEAIAGKDISVKNTKFFGCSIKRAGE
jgi:peroxiredoxin